MRCIKISQDELNSMKKLYESVMSNACHGLFFREGSVFGKEIASMAQDDRDNFMAVAKNSLIERGWLEDITFNGNMVTVKGSIEVSKESSPTCHRLRGILRYLYETYKNERIYCLEEKCESMGHEACIFTIKTAE
jgi:predicted hydrocarbon binding protein